MKKHELEQLCQKLEMETGTIGEMEARLVAWASEETNRTPHLIITERIEETSYPYDGKMIPSWNDKIKVIKVLRMINDRLWLREAKMLSESSLPIVVKIPGKISVNELRVQLEHCHFTKWEIKNL